jgi:ferredoxin
MSVKPKARPAKSDAPLPSDGEDLSFATPYLGRTVRIVGPVANMDPQTLPHAKAGRGELGKAVFNWRNNTISKDPLARVAYDTHAADPNNHINTFLRKGKPGAINPDRLAVDDPRAMSRHIKKVAREFGADVVGIGDSHPSFLFAGNYIDSGSGVGDALVDTPERLAKRLPHVIVAVCAWDYDLIQAHRHHIGDAAYDFTLLETSMVFSALEGYIREMGYTAIRNAVNPQAAALASGVGELGRNGMIITEKYGSRVHMYDVILTDLPLAADKPIDIGVEDFCKVCRKCAVTCPTNSISFEGKQVYNGVEKYKINWETCYKLRPLVADHWGQCLTCVTVCPYTKPNKWWRTLAIQSLKRTPIPLRSFVARGLKALDDRFWGVIPNRRVRWLGYDTGVKPGETACTIAGCTADHSDHSGGSFVSVEDIGYYVPLKENTNRFVKRG